MHAGLMLIDIQNDYFPGGKSALFQPERAAAQAKKALAFFRAHKLPVFHIAHINLRNDAAFFPPETTGCETHQSVYPIEGETRILKHAPDSFFETGLKDALDRQSVKHLVICGMMTHMCVDTTVRAARNFGYQVTLLDDACATKALEWRGSAVSAPAVQAAFMAALSLQFATIRSTDTWLKHNNPAAAAKVR